MLTIEESRPRVSAGLRKLTGFPEAVFFQSGTAALEAVLEVMTPPGARVAVPALGCWTVSFATTKLGRVPVFCDIDEAWSAATASRTDAAAAVLVDPWGGPADWKGARAGGPAICVADVTLAPGARLEGRPASAFCDAAILSLGAGKPLSVGGGGVALFHRPADAERARRLHRFGFADGRWNTRIDRYVFSPHLLPVLAERLDALDALEDPSSFADAARARLAGDGFASNPLRAGGRWGHATRLPVVLPEGFPIGARDVENAAVASGVPLARHPVSPPYREPAWGSATRGACCPAAESLADRLLFHAPLHPSLDEIERLLAFLAALRARWADFRPPFQVGAPSGALAPELERALGAGRLVRDISGALGLLDETAGALWPLDDREAALVQERLSSKPPAA